MVYFHTLLLCNICGYVILWVMVIGEWESELMMHLLFECKLLFRISVIQFYKMYFFSLITKISTISKKKKRYHDVFLKTPLKP